MWRKTSGAPFRIRLGWLVAVGAAASLAGCFPTPQSPRIDPGLNVSFAAVRLSDQTRDGESQGTDYMLTVAPQYGVGTRVEVGVPVGFYLEEGLGGRPGPGGGDREIVVMPYAKLALLPDSSRTHVAATFQAVGFMPSSVGLYVGRDLGSWEPHAGLAYIVSAGPAGDSPVVTRYQQKGQVLLAPTVGVTWLRDGRPMLGMGLLINRCEEGAVYGDFGQPTVQRTLVDLFVLVRVGTG